MILSRLIRSGKKTITFDELPRILDISPGYARKVVSEFVNKRIFLTEKDKNDKRKVVYSLNWKALRDYLLTIPNDYDDIIESIVDKKFFGKYVAIDNFEVLTISDDLQTLTEDIGIITLKDSILVTYVGEPTNKLILETE